VVLVVLLLVVAVVEVLAVAVLPLGSQEAMRGCEAWRK
jgi:hypothetical protein